MDISEQVVLTSKHIKHRHLKEEKFCVRLKGMEIKDLKRVYGVYRAFEEQLIPGFGALYVHL